MALLMSGCGGTDKGLVPLTTVVVPPPSMKPPLASTSGIGQAFWRACGGQQVLRVLCPILFFLSVFLKLSLSLLPGALLLHSEQPGVGSGMAKHQRACVAGSGFPAWAAHASGSRFAYFLGNPPCLGWQRRELTLSSDP